MGINFDVEKVRAQFPALKRTYNGLPVAYLDGPGGSQMAQSAIEAMTKYMMDGGANLHGVFPSSAETESVIASAREHVAALLDASPDEIAFGANMTTLNFAISRALSTTWTAGDKVVVTEIDHRANVDPWIMAAADRKIDVDWIPLDPTTLTLDLNSLKEVITPGTRVVAVNLASNGLGTVTDVRSIADRAHEVGALVVVDAVHGAPHIGISRDELGADVLLCSAYKFFGPHVGIACIARKLFEKLVPYKIAPSPTYIPDKLETGTQNHEGLAGVVGAVQFMASLGHGETLREQLVTALTFIEEYEEGLARHLRSELAKISGVRVYSAGDHVRKTPTVSFTVDGVASRKVCEFLLEHKSVFVADGDFYASTIAEKVGVLHTGGWVRAGLAPYSTVTEVQALIDGVSALSEGR